MKLQPRSPLFKVDESQILKILEFLQFMSVKMNSIICPNFIQGMSTGLVDIYTTSELPEKRRILAGAYDYHRIHEYLDDKEVSKWSFIVEDVGSSGVNKFETECLETISFGGSDFIIPKTATTLNLIEESINSTVNEFSVCIFEDNNKVNWETQIGCGSFGKMGCIRIFDGEGFIFFIRRFSGS